MIERPLWLRRVGKTTIARMLHDVVYLNWDLLSAVRALKDRELFLHAQAADAVPVFDEVHRLDDPSRGFVTFEKGWDTIRSDDRGLLWEHLVLDSLRFHYADEDIYDWQDKSRREIDFVIRRGHDRAKR
jgi:predicted AAA+ superfamily ATPase